MGIFSNKIQQPFDYRALFKYLPDKYRLKVGVALGSGGARGLSHIGVINILQSMGVRIDYIAGASVGALVGAFLAVGKLEELKKFASTLTRTESLKLADPMFPTSGLIEGKKIEAFLRKYFGNTKIEDTNIPFACVATDFYTGREVVLNRGDLVTAVRASISIPGVFLPVPVDGMLLVDGGVVNPVPVQVVRDLGARFTIAVNICPEIEKKMAPRSAGGPDQDRVASGSEARKLPNIFDVILGSIAIMESQVVAMKMKVDRPDIVIKPSVDALGTYDFYRYREGVDLGEVAAKGVAQKIERYVGVSKTAGANASPRIIDNVK